MIKWCESCNREVEPIKKPSWVVIILSIALICFFGIGLLILLIYGIYYALKNPNMCPICNQKAFLRPMHFESGIGKKVVESVYCPNCGKTMENNQCPSCGTKI